MSQNDPPTTPAGPISFKTNVNRHKTQKWVNAAKTNYDGDDWGGYDPYDEYGYEDQRTPAWPTNASQLPSQQPIPQRPSQEYRRQPPQQPLSRVRTRSFDQGDDMQPMARDAPPPAQWFPPRKSSLSAGSDYDSQAQAAEARAIAESITNPAVNTGAVNTEKPLPFIRPSDIYKRIPDEIRRQSEEGSRPSLDSLQRVKSDEQPALTPVQEARESRLFPDATGSDQSTTNAAPAHDLTSLQTATATDPLARETSPTLPPVSIVSGFGEDLFSPKVAASEATLTSSQQPGPALDTTTIDRTPTTFSSLQTTPTLTRPGPGHDPAAEILAERQQETAETDLQHNPSLGFRSAVHQAFDEPTLSRDSSQSQSGSGGGVSRSDTTSTAGISPIMSHVPNPGFPPIAEETTSSRPRQPSPGHSRDGDTDQGLPEGFEPGYRRSLDPPSTGTSPARTPALENAADRRLSTPLSAVVTGNEAPDVSDQAAEIPEPNLHLAGTSASEVGSLPSASVPITGRGRSGTDYSMREADLVEQINAAPGKDPKLGHAAKNSQDLFLQTHNMQTPTPPLTRTLSGGIGRRADSPAKSRVREIADRYEETSRRNSTISVGSSQSSWSRFGDDEEKPRLKRAGTSQSNLANEIRPEAGSSGLPPSRPELGREPSFKPDLPGAWQSEAPTPAVESPPTAPVPSSSTLHVERPDASRAETPIDLTPTTKTYQLQGTTGSERSPVDVLKDAGSALAASIVSTHGVGHQTRDFASKEPPAPVEQPEFAPRQMTGQLAPPLLRHETDQSSDPPASVASSFVPTPARDTPQLAGGSGDSGLQPENAGYFDTVAPLRVRSREPSPEHPEIATPPGAAPAHLSHFSNDSADTEHESDRLHEEIVTSLRTTSEGIDRDQDALDAPGNARRVEQDKDALPAAEIAGLGAAALQAGAAAGAAGAGLPALSPPRPGLLDTRFSWENREPQRQSGSYLGAKSVEGEPASPEIYPETAYERPRSKQLHVMNAEDGDVSPDTPVREIPPTPPTATAGSLGVPELRRPEAAAAEAEITRSLSQRVRGLKSQEDSVSPITKSQEHLLPETAIGTGSPSQSLRELAPSPVSNDDTSARIPSYYAGATDDTPTASQKEHEDTPTLQHQPTTSPARPRSGPGAVNIPPFRNILALKTADERIKTYNETRGTFANMDTGLCDWLITMTHKHPDVSVAAAQGKPPLQTQVSSSATNTWKRGHRPAPSIAGFKHRFASGSSAQVEQQGRSTSTGSGPQSGLEPSDTANKTSGGGASRIDMDRVQEQMQQRGKEFMKSASVFGGKTASGAKGLLAKGRSKWGGSVRRTGGGGEDPNQSVTSKAGSSNPSSVKHVDPPATSPTAPTDFHQPSVIGTVPVADSDAISSAANRPMSNIDEVNEIPQQEEILTNESASLGAELDEQDAEGVDDESIHVHANVAADAKAAHQPDQGEANDLPVASDVAVLKETSSIAEPTSFDQGHQQDNSPTRVNGVAALTTSASSASAPKANEVESSQSAVAAEPDAVSMAPLVDSGASLPARPEHTRRYSIPLGSEASTEQSQSLTEFLATEPPRGWDNHETPTKKDFKFPPSSLERLSRPGLSRQGSSISAAAFRRRERSQTPSSASARSSSSRPLSQVFTRLREKSRSMSRSRKDESRSRPPSLVLSHSNLLEDEELEPRGAKRVASHESRNTDEAAAAAALMASGPTDLALDDFSDLAIDPSKSNASPMMAMSSPISSQRTETWNSPEATIPPSTPTNKDTHNSSSTSSGVGRLGVLPSPAPTATTFPETGERHASNEQQRRRSSAAAWRKGLEEQFGGALASVPSETPSEDDSKLLEENTESVDLAENAEKSPSESTPRQADFGTKTNATNGVLGPTTVPAAASEPGPEVISKDMPASLINDLDQDYSPPNTPSPPRPSHQQQRKVSDLASLPSQIRRASQPSSPVKSPSTSLPSTAAHSRANSQALAVILPSNLEATSSRESGLSDAEYIKASPVTIKPAAPALVQHASFKKEALPEEDELYESTPVAPVRSLPWRAMSKKDSERDDEELYGINPVVMKSRTPWRAQIAEQERELERLERERKRSDPPGLATGSSKKEKKLAEATHNPYQLSLAAPVDSIAATAGADPDKWEDARSEVSAEDGAHESSHRTSTNPTTSRHSSVSSLGGGDRMARIRVEQEEPMSAQAVPAGPATAAAASPLQKLTSGQPPTSSRNPGSGDYSDRFASRQYMQRPGMAERPLSYMPSQRDSAGFVQENISTAQGGVSSSPALGRASVDLSGIAGPPPGTQPYLQHPAMRLSGHVEPTQYEKMRTSMGSGVLVSPGHSPQNSADLSGRDSRQSGFFRGDAATYPTPRTISDQHGLEDLAYAGPPSPEEQQHQQHVQDPSKQGSRKSGLWATFSSRRSSGAKIEPNTQSRESSVAPLAGDYASTGPSTAPPVTLHLPAQSSTMDRMDSSAKGRKTLTKPQRASSNAIDLEPKKKRFSGLKSFLGRSSTSAGSDKVDREPGKKLKKLAPVADIRAPASPPQSRPLPRSRPSDSATVQGAVSGYAEYERARRREGRADDQQQQVMPHTKATLPQPRGRHDDEEFAFVPSGDIPPAEGWYAPARDQDRHYSMPSRASPGAPDPNQPRTSSQAMPEFRRLHSLGATPGRARQIAQVPEAFRPVDASFNRPVKPIGPPLPGQFHAPQQQLQIPERQAGYANQPPISPTSPSRPREGSYGSEHTNPISGRSEYWPSAQRPFGSVSGPSVSPIKTTPDSGSYAPAHRERMGSIGQEVARSPAKEYGDQQTPWSITLPPGHSRQSSWNIPPDAIPSGPPRGTPDVFYDAQQYQYAGSQPPSRSAIASPPPGPYQQQQQHFALQQQGLPPPRQPPVPFGFPEHFARGQPPPRPPPKQLIFPEEEGMLGAYPSPPYSPEQHPPQQMYAHSTAQGASTYQGPRTQSSGQPTTQQGWFPRQGHRPSQGRYYAQQQQQQAQPQQFYQYREESYHPRPHGGMQRSFTTGHDQNAYNAPHVPPNRRRPSNGYSGRRDDPTVGEEELIMRGASYPGQEWQPQGLGRNGWD